MDPVPVSIFVVLFVVIVVGPLEQVRIPHDRSFIDVRLRVSEIQKKKNNNKIKIC